MFFYQTEFSMEIRSQLQLKGREPAKANNDKNTIKMARFSPSLVQQLILGWAGMLDGLRRNG